MPIRATSPYAIAGTNGAGHMRKLVDLESEVIRLAIGRYEGRMSEVARRLGIGRSTLYRKLKEFGLEPDDSRENVKEASSNAASDAPLNAALDGPEAKRASA